MDKCSESSASTPPRLSEGFVSQWLEAYDQKERDVSTNPFAEVKSLWGKRFEVCAPLLSYSHLSNTDALRIGRQRAGDIVIRFLESFSGDEEPGIPTQSLVNLSKWNDVDEYWKGALSPNVRKKVRRTERDGLSATVDCEGAFYDTFYGFYLSEMHRHGTPAFGRELLRKIFDRLESRLIVIHRDSSVIACYFLILDKKVGLLQWGGVKPGERLGGGALLAEWTALQLAFSNGCDWLDLGRSEFQGPVYKHKQHWRPEVFRCSEFPKQLKPVYEKYAFASKLWRLIPSALAARLGPVICRRLKDA